MGGIRADHRHGGGRSVTRVALRLARLEAVVPKPAPPVAYDLSRLTADQGERMAELRERVDAVGLAGLTDAEVEEGAAISEILLAADPAGDWP